MARYFIVDVDHYSVMVTEVFEAPKKQDWVCRVNGESVIYHVKKATKSNIKNWFERGTLELQYHAKTLYPFGFVLWDKRNKNPKQPKKSEKAIREKMEKLL